MRLSVLLLPFLLVACGGDDATTDAGTAADAGPTADANGCVPFAVLPSNWRPIDAVSSGAVTDQTGVLLIDATAGGTAAAADNPFVYLDLDTGAKVGITDVVAYDSQAWDIGLKRASIKVNGGDAGTGGRSAARVTAATLAEVTTAPAASAFAVDDWTDASCALLATSSGEPMGALADWYDYDDATHVLTPKAEVYIIKRDDTHMYKVRVETYYGDAGNPMRGGMYRIEWAPL